MLFLYFKSTLAFFHRFEIRLRNIYEILENAHSNFLFDQILSFNIQQIRAGIGHEVDVELEIKCLREYMIRRLSNWLGQAFLWMNLKIMGNIIYLLDMEVFAD